MRWRSRAHGWQSYSSQETTAGADVAKLMLGMPSEVARWRGNDALEQLRWSRDHGKSGVSFWDAQLPSAAWRTREVWTVLREIRDGKKLRHRSRIAVGRFVGSRDEQQVGDENEAATGEQLPGDVLIGVANPDEAGEPAG